MNALTKIDETPRAQLIQALRDSVWPGASEQSIEMAVGYCRVNGLDPFLKPVHIVPFYDSKTRTSRDVLMPGIADYRIKAARSGQYAGISEPEFGPDVTTKLGGAEVTFPAWCKIVVKRIVAGHPRDYVAKEMWLENYATAGRDTLAPNSMWKKRPYGQLAKCAEAQALRKAFPEFSGGMATAEEMEGKENFIEGTAEVVRESARAPAAAAPSGPSEKTAQTVDALINFIEACESQEEWLERDSKSASYREKLKAAHPDLYKNVEDAYEEARKRLFPEPNGAAESEAAKPSDDDAQFANNLIRHFQTAKSIGELTKMLKDNAEWGKRIEDERPELYNLVDDAYYQRETDFIPQGV